TSRWRPRPGSTRTSSSASPCPDQLASPPDPPARLPDAFGPTAPAGASVFPDRRPDPGRHRDAALGPDPGAGPVTGRAAVVPARRRESVVAGAGAGRLSGAAARGALANTAGDAPGGGPAGPVPPPEPRGRVAGLLPRQHLFRR